MLARVVPAPWPGRLRGKALSVAEKSSSRGGHSGREVAELAALPGSAARSLLKMR